MRFKRSDYFKSKGKQSYELYIDPGTVQEGAGLGY